MDHKIICEMMMDRNYKLVDGIYQNEESEKINVIDLTHVEKLGIKNIQEILEEYTENLLLIVNEYPSSKANEIIYNENRDIEIFKSSELMINITRHFLQPGITLLSAEEKKIFLQDTNFDPKLLPFILKTDPVVKYYNAKQGNIFEFVDGEYIYYRIVI